MERITQTVRTNLFLFVWVFLVLFFTACSLFVFLMNWTDERLTLTLFGAITSGLNAIAMLTNTAAKGGNRLSDIGSGGAVDSTTTTTLTSKTESTEETKSDKEKPHEKID